MTEENTLHIAVCDDYEQDRENIILLLNRYLEEKHLSADIHTFSSGEEFLESDTSEYLLVFMDIFMKEKNGIQTIEELRKKNPKVQVVFGSTSREFAVEAFQLEALHYLLKPVEFDAMSSVLDKFFEFFTGIRTIDVKIGRNVANIYLKDILWIAADGKKAILHTIQGEFPVSNSITELMDNLPTGEFYRPIRWAILSFDKIKTLCKDHVILIDETEIPISRGEREPIKLRYADFRWSRMRKKTEEL